MKIAFYTPTLNIGGYEKVVVNYANAFSQNHEVIILCGKAEGILANDICENVKIINFNIRARGLLFMLIRWLKNNTADILYVPFATYSALAVIAKRFSCSKVIIYSAQHGFEKASRLLNKFLGYFLRKVDVLIAVSNAVADYDSKRLKIDRNFYYIFDNPVFNSNKLILNEEKIGQNENVIITCGRLAPDKHIEIPIKIIAELKGKLNVKLCVLGEGTERGNLENLAKKLDVADQVEFVGYVSNPMSYIKNCDIYMQPSEIESFGNGVIEALYVNVPAVITDCGGPVDIIEKNKYGINIGRFDSPDVIPNGIAAVIRIINKEIVFRGLHEKALKYDAANLEKQFLEPYYECIKKN